MMRGDYVARDGARIEYDTEARPGHIGYYDSEGVCQRVTSGEIDEKHVMRALKAFRIDHPDQMRLF